MITTIVDACRNLKIAFFSQHHVDQLVMEVSALEFIQSKFPGTVLVLLFIRQ